MNLRKTNNVNCILYIGIGDNDISQKAVQKEFESVDLTLYYFLPTFHQEKGGRFSFHGPFVCPQFE